MNKIVPAIVAFCIVLFFGAILFLVFQMAVPSELETLNTNISSKNINSVQKNQENPLLSEIFHISGKIKKIEDRFLIVETNPYIEEEGRLVINKEILETKEILVKDNTVIKYLTFYKADDGKIKYEQEKKDFNFLKTGDNISINAGMNIKDRDSFSAKEITVKTRK